MFKKIVASFATVLVAAGVSLVAVAAPVSAVDASLLAPSANFTFVTEGDAIFNSTSETEGSWAVGGDLTQQGNKYTLLAGGHQATAALPVVESKATRLLVAGSTSLAPGENAERINVNPSDGYGNVTLGSATPPYSLTADGRIQDATKAYIKTGNPEAALGTYPTSATAFASVFGSDTFSGYRTLSTELTTLSGSNTAAATILQGPANGTPLSNSNTFGIGLVANKTNVWNPTVAQFTAMQGGELKFYGGAPISASTPLIINVPASATTFNNPVFADGPSDVANYVLWNVTGDSFEITGAKLFSGSILAPNAAFTFSKDTPAEGQFVTKTALITGSGEIHHESFRGQTTPTPSVASASVTTTPATCSAAESSVVVTVANATYAVSYPTASTYTVTATATGNSLFSNGTVTRVIDGTFAPKRTEGCDLPPLALVTPTAVVTQPSCTVPGSYTLGSEGGDVVWTVDGQTPVVNGTYPAPLDYSDVTVSAKPADEKNGLADWVNPTVLTFTEPTGCVETPPAAGVASAAVVTTPATCSAAETGVVVTVVNAIFALTYPTESTYRVLATATANNLFSNKESTMVIAGSLSPKLTEGCELPSFALVTPTVSVTQPTCTAAGSYTLGSLVGDVVWTVDGTRDVTNGTYAAPAGSSTVTISAAPAVEGDGLDPDWSNPVVLTFTAPAGACSFGPPTLAFDPPTLAYTGLTIGTGLSLAAGLLFVGFAGLLIARRRKLHS